MKPEVQHIAITRTDGSLAVMQFVTKAEFEREATDEAIEAEIAKAGIKATGWRRISPDDLPQDRADRDAWKDTGKTIVVDASYKAALDQAKAATRDPLVELDVLRLALVDKGILTAADVASVTLTTKG